MTDGLSSGEWTRHTHSLARCTFGTDYYSRFNLKFEAKMANDENKCDGVDKMQVEVIIMYS